MIVHNVLQGSPEWLALRAGIPTASGFDSIVTPGGQPSKSAERYLFGLLAERIMGHPRIEAVSTWMQRGNEMEAEAVSFYELQRDLETVPVGFVTNDAGTVGASPDRLVGEDGLLEIKCPSEAVHVSYLLKKSVDQAYYPQVMGQLWITERKWADILAFHPELPPALIRVERDEEFIKLLEEAVGKFSLLLEDYAADLTKRGWITVKKPVETAPEQPQEGFFSQEDVDFALSLPAQPRADSAPAEAMPRGMQSSPLAPLLPPVVDYPKGEGGGSMQPAPETRKRLTKGKTNEEIASDMGLFMKAAKIWKGRLSVNLTGEDSYYEVLGSLGVEHANELRGHAERLKALQGWSAAHASGSGANPAGPVSPQAEPEPGAFSLQAPPVNLPPAPPEASSIASAEPPARPWDPGFDKFQADMNQILMRAPAEFMRTLAGWNFASIAEIPINERLGRLEAMRTSCRYRGTEVQRRRRPTEELTQ